MSIYAQIACSLPDKVAIVEAGDIGELVYYRSILRSRDHLTDGVIDRRLIDRWFAGIRGKPATHLNRLRDVGLLVDHPDGWCIPPDVWNKWNPTKDEVEQKRAAETERKRRWKERRNDDSGDEEATEARQRRDDRRDGQPESKTEPEPKPKPSRRLSTTPIALAPAVDDDEETRYGHIVDHIAKQRTEAANPRSRRAYSAAVKESIHTDHGEEIHRLCDKYPDAPYDAIAAHIEGNTSSLRYHQPKETA